MSRYYTVIIFLSVAAMLIIQISVHRSGTLAKNRKRIFHYLYSSIALAALCEWFGAFLQGTGPSTRGIHIFVKAVELSVAPTIAVQIAWLLGEKKSKLTFFLILAHALAECLSGFYGFIYAVDENSVYTHAGFYWIYVACYLGSAVYAVYVIIKNMKRYQYTGVDYFLMTTAFMLCGLSIQLLDSSLKVDYLALALASLMMYIFTLEMIQQTDQLTELINRRGYENYISHIDEPCAFLFFDIDDFKDINDRYGHTFGDLCISQTGRTIKKVYARYGKCFRFGGDEFCVVLTKNLPSLEALNSKFFELMALTRAKESRIPFVSIGYAHFDPGRGNVLNTIEQADQMMYQFKEKHKQAKRMAG